MGNEAACVCVSTRACASETSLLWIPFNEAQLNKFIKATAKRGAGAWRKTQKRWLFALGREGGKKKKQAPRSQQQ